MARERMFALITLLLGLALSVQSAQAKEIRFAMEATYPPFEFTNEKNEVVGFDVDLANALCDKLGKACSFHIQSFDSLITSLKFRRFDAAISGMDITAEREKQVLFTNPYYDNAAVFVAAKGKFKDIAELKDLKIGIQNGSTHQKYIHDKFPKQKTASYTSVQHAFIDLQNGRVDAVFGDTAVVNAWLPKATGYGTVGAVIKDERYFGRGYGIAVNLHNPELRDELNQALLDVVADGTYDAIYKRWFQQL